MNYKKIARDLATSIRCEMVKTVREVFNIREPAPLLIPCSLTLYDLPSSDKLSKTIPYPFTIPAGKAHYLCMAWDTDFKVEELRLTGGLSQLQVTSMTSNGIRDQVLLAEVGISAEAFADDAVRPIVLDAATSQARQLFVVEVTNISAEPATVRAVVMGSAQFGR